MVRTVGVITGGLAMLATALVLSVGCLLLPFAILLQAVAARWAARRGQALEFWRAGTIGVLLALTGIWLVRR